MIIEIKSINNLLGYNFFIPSYQRGYRWGCQEITDLLEDLKQYSSSNSIGKFYCLQPLVIQKMSEERKLPFKNEEGFDIKKDWYEVIDGQQRLTTIWIILSFLREVADTNGLSTDKYTLYFETRKRCYDFFVNEKYKKGDDTNPDFYHISKAYEYIGNWFGSRQNKSYRGKISQVLLSDEKNTCFIWYELNEKINKTTDVFSRLNEGKIALTDSELIRALFFQSDRFIEKINRDTEEVPKEIKMRLCEIAVQWQNFSSKLQDDDFWFFLNNEERNTDERMNYIFYLIACIWNTSEHKYVENLEKTRHPIYLIFQKYFDDSMKEVNNDALKTINKLWREVESVFLILEELFDSRKWYHLVGLWTKFSTESIDKTLIDLIKEFQEGVKTPSAIMTSLVSKISKIILNLNLKIETADEVEVNNALNKLTYSNNYEEIKKILLFFNVWGIYQNDPMGIMRFPFSLYKRTERKYKMSLEHIHPQNPENFINDEEKTFCMLVSTKEALTRLRIPNKDNEEINRFIKEIEQYASDKNNYSDNKEKIVKLVSSIFSYYNAMAGVNEDDSLCNLALLDGSTNAALNNNFFDRKRDILVDQEKKGYFIPIGTKYVFAKYFSKNAAEVQFWNEKDRKDYLDKIKETIVNFINPKTKEVENG